MPRAHAPIVALALASGLFVAVRPAAATDIESRARALVAQLVAGDFARANASFDDNLRKALSAERLRAVWMQLAEHAGRFQRVESTRIDPTGAYRIVFVVCAFEREPIGVKIVFDADDRIAGLFMGPAQPSAMTPPWTPPAYASPGRFEERSVTIASGEWKLPGQLALPRGTGPFPAAVLVHGSGPHDADETVGAVKPFRDLAMGLASRGVAVLRYDKRTHVLSGRDDTPSIERMTVREETIDDACAAVALLAGTPGIDARRIWIIGHSLGGMLAPRIAAQERRVAGIAILAGNARPLEDLLVEQIRFLAERDGAVAPAESAQIRAVADVRARIRDPKLAPDAVVDVLGAPTPGAYWLDLRAYRPTEAAAALDVPVLVLQGGRDYQVGRTDFDLWQKALAGEAGATCKWYPALDHLFVARAGAPGPETYAEPGHVDAQVIEDLARAVAGTQRAPR